MLECAERGGIGDDALAYLERCAFRELRSDQKAWRPQEVFRVSIFVARRHASYQLRLKVLEMG